MDYRELTDIQKRRIDQAVAPFVYDRVYSWLQHAEWKENKSRHIVYTDRQGRVWWGNREWRPTVYPNDWQRVERMMKKTFLGPYNRKHFIRRLIRLIRPGTGSRWVQIDQALAFELVAAEPHLKCIAFLMAMEVDIDKLMAEAAQLEQEMRLEDACT